MKFLIDMNLSPRWAECLATAGFDAIHWARVGRADSSDRDILGWAADHDFIVITADLDFPAILASTRDGRPSVILIRSDSLAPERLLNGLLDSIRLGRQELERGAILLFEPGRSRIRLLPLQS